MEFVPGAQNTPKSEFQPRNSRGDFQPPPQQPPPSAMSVPPPPLPVTPTKDAGPLSLNEFKPQSKLKSLTPGVPEFVPRPLSQGSSMLPTPVTQGQVASAIPRTNAGGLMSNDFVSGECCHGFLNIFVLNKYT